MTLTFFKNRKGSQFADQIVTIIMLLFFAFLILFMGSFFGKFNDQAQVNIEDENAKHALDVAFGDRFSKTWDSAFMMMFVGFTLALVISAFFLDNNPVFFIVSLISFVAFMMFAGFINNAFLDIAQSNSMGNEIDKYPMMLFIFNNLFIFVVFIFILTAIALFAKRGTSGGEG